MIEKASIALWTKSRSLFGGTLRNKYIHDRQPSLLYRSLVQGEKWLYGFLAVMEMCAKAIAVAFEVGLKFTLVWLELTIKYVVLPLAVIWCVVWLALFIF